jgi:hypothetical protein
MNKNGKKPLSEKKGPSALNLPDFYNNRLQVPAEVLKDVESKGQEARWINYKKFIENDNTHTWGWKPYKKPAEMITADALLNGAHPDGIIKRGDVMLAVRSKEHCDIHRSHVREKTLRQNMSIKGRSAELRSMARRGNFGTKVIDEGSESSE